MAKIYETYVVNEGGTSGHIETEDGLRLDVASPTDPSRTGPNPEQFMGMAWSTCLNATMRAIMKAQKIDAESKVRVEVSFNKQDSGFGYYFTMDAYASIEGMSEAETLKLVEQAHKRCPVSLLIEKNPHVHVHAETY